MSAVRTSVKEKRERVVKSLASLYTVVIGVALTRAVLEVVGAEGGLKSIKLDTALLFTAFLATLLPFFHGALRHLDDVYVENDNTHVKNGALVLDVLLLFVHALAFVLLALLLRKPGHYAWVMTGLILVDVLWGLFVTYGPSSKGSGAEPRWTLINFVFVGCAITFLIWNRIGLEDLAEPIRVVVPVVFACVLRTVVDYASCWNFYFPAFQEARKADGAGG